MGEPSTSDAIFRGLLDRVDTNALSRWMGAATRLRVPRVVLQRVIDAFIAAYDVEMADVAVPAGGWETFDAFFTRRLRPGARPRDDGAIVSPADGTLLTCGEVREGLALDVKGSRYTLGQLLGHPTEARRFEGGSFWIIYLSPRNYHRVHTPCAAVVRGIRYIPGQLYPVNDFGVRAVDQLFAVNERVTTFLEREAGGRLAVTLVGAYGVGNIELCFDRFRANRAGATTESRVYPADTAPKLSAGDELGVFHMGSTVIVVAEAGNRCAEGPQPGEAVRVGQTLRS